MLTDWPVYDENRHYPKEEAMIDRVKDVVRGMRNLRTDMEVPPSRKAKIIITSDDAAVRGSLPRSQSLIRHLPVLVRYAYRQVQRAYRKMPFRLLSRMRLCIFHSRIW